MLAEQIEKIIKESGVECLPDSTSPHPYYVYPEKLSKVIAERLVIDKARTEAILCLKFGESSREKTNSFVNLEAKRTGLTQRS